MKNVLVAMSGGVDSSVAAFLLKQSGHNLTGAMMKLYTNDDILQDQRGCCSLEDAEDARSVANKLDIPFYVFNFTDSFTREVIERFVKAYANAQTPNPCIDCNRYMKFQRFIRRAAEMECTHIATGHYAVITQDPSGRYLLKTGLDKTKDQSYVLYSMTQAQLSQTLLPLGSLTKDEVLQIAIQQGFINAKKRDSQDICFAPDGNYAGFVEKYAGVKTGRFIDKNNQTLGQHKGIVHYTIGQRKGLGLSAPTPLYVTALNSAENTVTLGQSEDLFTTELTAADINLIPLNKIETPIKIQAKIRYSHKPQPATAWQTDEDTLKVKFDTPQRAVTPGQAVVLYDGDIVMGGGTISG